MEHEMEQVAYLVQGPTICLGRWQAAHGVSCVQLAACRWPRAAAGKGKPWMGVSYSLPALHLMAQPFSRR
jgi:hypothetical protein